MVLISLFLNHRWGDPPQLGRITTETQPFTKQVFYKARSTNSCFNFQYPLFSLMSSSSCKRLLPLLLVTSILLSIFPSITFFRRQFVRKMWRRILSSKFHFNNTLLLLPVAHYFRYIFHFTLYTEHGKVTLNVEIYLFVVNCVCFKFMLPISSPNFETVARKK